MTEGAGGAPLNVGTTGFVALSDSEGAMVAVRLRYEPRDCVAVRLVLLGPDGMEVVWTFAWELLARGLLGPAGDGDIGVRPSPGPMAGVEVTLVALSPTRVWLPVEDVARFVRQVRTRVGADTVAIASALDRELAAITHEV